MIFNSISRAKKTVRTHICLLYHFFCSNRCHLRIISTFLVSILVALPRDLSRFGQNSHKVYETYAQPYGKSVMKSELELL